MLVLPLCIYYTFYRCPNSAWVLVLFLLFQSLFSLFFSSGGVFLFFTYGCSGSLLLHRLFSSCSVWRLLSSCLAGAAHCSGSSCLQHRVKGRGFSGCSTWAQWLQLPGSKTQAQQLWSMGSSPQHVGFFQIRDWTHVSCTGRWALYHWATREPWKFLLRHLQACRFFHQPCPVFIHSSKASFISVRVFFLFGSLDVLSLFWQFPPFLAYCLLYPLALSVVIIVVLNSWSDNFNYPAFSDFDVPSISSNCIFWRDIFKYPWNAIGILPFGNTL